ncbi:MAG: DJ-1/PfpI family protein [Clostridiales bacterium]|nr:DJ-1/PfpI family protein [Clostridiales bacterium]
MPKVYAMIADGTEEVECLAVVDLLRRAKIDTALVSVDGKQVESSHKINIKADYTVGEVDLTAADLIFLPGGMPGSEHLAACGDLISAVDKQLKAGKRVAAICAAPAVVLGANGFLRGKKAVCFPGFEDGCIGATVMPSARVVTDGNVTTARGMGCAVDLGLELIGLLIGKDKADAVKKAIQY